MHIVSVSDVAGDSEGGGQGELSWIWAAAGAGSGVDNKYVQDGVCFYTLYFNA